MTIAAMDRKVFGIGEGRQGEIRREVKDLVAEIKSLADTIWADMQASASLPFDISPSAAGISQALKELGDLQEELQGLAPANGKSASGSAHDLYR